MATSLECLSCLIIFLLFTYGGYPSKLRSKNKFPTKSALSWTPGKSLRPKRSGGTGRLLQRAISDIQGVTPKTRKRKSNDRKEITEELQSEVLELHVQQPDGLKQEDGYVNEEEDIGGSQEEVEPVVVVKRKKSIKERLDPLPDEDEPLQLTRVERATLAAVRKVLPPKQIDLRQILKNRKDKISVTKPLETTTRFVVTLDTNTEDLAKVHVSSSSSRNDDDRDGNKGMTERCKFWPNCKNGESCTYHHPSVPCRPKRSGGTGRLLQKAISDIHGVTPKTPKTRKRKSNDRKEITEELQSEVLELHVQQPDGLKQEDGYVNEEEDNGGSQDGSQEEVEPVVVVKRKKSIKERLDPLPDEDEPLQLTRVERATLAAVRKVLPPKQIDLRQILKNRKDKISVTKPLETTTRFVVTLDTNTEDLAKVHVSSSSSSRDDDDRDGNKGMTERCKFWPNCKNGESCTYHHPSVPCRLFPKCKYGQKCCFVHPLCKYDGRCTNPTCYYLHSVTKQSVTPQIQPKVLSHSIGSPFSQMSQFTYGGYPSKLRSKNKFPTKSALSWTPGKSLSEST